MPSRSIKEVRPYQIKAGAKKEGAMKKEAPKKTAKKSK